MRRTTSVRERVGSAATTATRPAVGTRTPVQSFTVVDFPAPLGPM